MLVFKKFSFAYEGEKEATLKNISLSVCRGEFVLFCGASGSGKSTLLRVINRLTPEFFPGNSTGEAFFCGKALSSFTAADLSRFAGSVFQDPSSQFFALHVGEELAFHGQNLGLDKKVILKRVKKTAEDFTLTPLLTRSIFQLSGGEAQKTACASVATLDQELFLLDEPSAALDDTALSNLRGLLKKWKKSGKTVIIAEHQLYYFLDLVDAVYYFSPDGRINRYSKAEFLQLSPFIYKKLSLRARQKADLMILPLLEKAKNENPQLYKWEKVRYPKNSRKNPLFFIPEYNLASGEIYTLIGANGSGKSTLLRVLSGLLPAKGNWHFINGRNKKFSGLKKEVFLLSQEVKYQFFKASVEQEIGAVIPRKRIDKAKQTDFYLQSLRLLDKKKVSPLNLSGGEKQRLGIALALASEKPILLLDEPTSALDFASMIETAQLLRAHADGRLIIITSHDKEFIAVVSDAILRLKEGHLYPPIPLKEWKNSF